MKQLLEIDEARRLLLSSLSAASNATESIAVTSARNRITRTAITTPMHVPPFTASAMDGYAVCSTDRVFAGAPPHVVAIHGTSRAGHPFAGALAPNKTIRIFTGAMMPERADAVVLQENATKNSDSIVAFDETPTRGRWVRAAGNDVTAGAQILPAGRALNAFDLASLASCGIAHVDVRPRLRLALFATGDELKEAGQPIRPGEIYDSNRLVLRELLAECPVAITDLGILPDDEALTEQTLAHAAGNHDIILTSGGVSVGDADHVRAALSRVGRLDFWKIALKPGKPLAYGRIRDCAFFGLPGNPVSTIVTFLLIVRPAIAVLAGATVTAPLRITARCVHAIEHDPGRAEYQRGIYELRSDGIEVRATGDQSSNRIQSFNEANCLIELDKENPGIPRGARVQVLPFRGLLG